MVQLKEWEANTVTLVVPQQKSFDDQPFPKILGPNEITTKEQLLNWARKHHQELAFELRDQGAILFRNFPINGAEDFNDFVEALGIENLPYVGGAAVRHVIFKHVHTTNESPPDQVIPFHHEMAQVPLYPQTLFFYCDVTPSKGGETSILRSDIAYRMIAERAPAFCKQIEEKGVIYTRIIPKEDDPQSPVGRGWKSTFQCQTKEEAIQAASKLGVTLEWLPNGDVKTISPVLPAVKTLSKVSDKKVWFNSVIAAYTGCGDPRNDPKKSISYGDGTLLKEDDVQVMVDIMEEIHVAIPWQKGDVMWIDNNQVMHSRKPNFVPPRKIMAYLGRNCPY